MHNTYEAPQVEVVSFSLSQTIAAVGNDDPTVDAGNTLPALS